MTTDQQVIITFRHDQADLLLDVLRAAREEIGETPIGNRMIRMAARNTNKRINELIALIEDTQIA